MTEMIERVARAIQRVREQNGAPAYDGLDDLFDRGTAQLLRDELADEARAAIKAMREPTEAMMHAVDCGGEKRDWASGKAWSLGWCAMIDAALGK